MKSMCQAVRRNSPSVAELQARHRAASATTSRIALVLDAAQLLGT